MQKSSSGKPAQSAGRPQTGVQHAVMTDDRASPGGHDDPGVKKLQACPRVVGRGPMGPPILGRAAEPCVLQRVVVEEGKVGPCAKSGVVGHGVVACQLSTGGRAA